MPVQAWAQFLVASLCFDWNDANASITVNTTSK